MNALNRRDLIRLIGLSTIGAGLSGYRTTTFSSYTNQSGSSDSVIRRLLFNENPYGPSEAVKARILEVINRSNRYATFHQYDFLALKKVIAREEGLQPENILLGHGSFEPLISLAVHFGIDQGEIIVPSPTFDVVGLFARKIGARVVPVEVTSEFQINLDEMNDRISPQTRLLTLCNPNNPTGKNLDPEDLRSFCQLVSPKCPVLIDEAYIHFLDDWREHTMASLIAEGENVLITRTFSKIHGMAGLRIGYLMGPSSLISELEAKFTLGFPGNMPNSLSVAAAIAALDDKNFITESRVRNREGRTDLYRSFDQLGIAHHKSTANFVYFDVVKFSEFRDYMRKNDIVLAGGWPTKSRWARVTIGTPAEMEYFVSRLEGKPWL